MPSGFHVQASSSHTPAASDQECLEDLEQFDISTCASIYIQTFAFARIKVQTEKNAKDEI